MQRKILLTAIIICLVGIGIVEFIIAKEIRKMKPADEDIAWQEQAEKYVAKNDLENARSAYQHELEQTPTNSEARNSIIVIDNFIMAQKMVEAARFDEAQKLLTQVQANEASGQLQEAIANLQKQIDAGR